MQSRNAHSATLPVRFHLLEIDDLRRQSARFNDLWSRSRVALPTARAEHVLHWQKAFAPANSPLRIAIVEQGGRWLAALALVARRRGLIPIGELPTNPWQPSGELLLDEETAAGHAIDRLLRGLESLRTSVFDLGIILPGTARWRLFVEALTRRSIPHCIAPRFDVALIDCAANWQAQCSGWSTNHRRRIKRNQKLLDFQGLDIEFHRLAADRTSLAGLDQLWRLESLSWKGAQGDAVEHDPRLVEFYREQAILLAETEGDSVSSHVAILKQAAKPLAAMYYWRSKDVCHLWKTAYDPAAAELSPGSLLLQGVLKTHIERGDVGLFNLMGEMSAAHASYATRKFEVARLLFAGDCGLGRAAVAAYRAIRRLRGQPRWKPGALSEAWPLSTSSPRPTESVLAR